MNKISSIYNQSLNIIAALGLVILLSANSIVSQAFAQRNESIAGSVDLRPVTDAVGLTPRLQGGRGTCSVFAITQAMEFAIAKRDGIGKHLSVEYLNWASNNSTDDKDDGGFFSDLWEGYTTHGICTEKLMPYLASYKSGIKPKPGALKDAEERRKAGLQLHWIKEWDTERGLDEKEFNNVKETITRGWPVCGGFLWPKQQVWKDGVLEMCPRDQVRDGHSVILVGYRDDANMPGGGVFLVRNSAGPSREGFLTYEFVKTYMNDAVSIDYDSSFQDRFRHLGIDELYRLDLIPKLKRGVKIGCVSSYDRTGDNDDGFSGAYSFIRKENNGLVIADLEGPGIIYRIHTPTPSEDTIEFYFDGESSPRISRKFSELFGGTHPPFLAPLVGSGVGGHYSYIPLSYQKSCKILIKAEKFYFYQINYVSYPQNTIIQTYTEPPSDEFIKGVIEAGKIIKLSGSDISRYLAAKEVRIETLACSKSLKPKSTILLFETMKPGRIVGLKLFPASVFAGKNKDVIINVYWDGEKKPAVSCPVGDFFGYSFGEPAMRSLFLGTFNDTNYIYLPMPFERSARIELSSERESGPAIDIHAEILIAHRGKFSDEGRFYARWNRENPTKDSIPYTYLKTTGSGHVVGVILQSQGFKPGGTPFFEGDDRAVVDGELRIPGTGTEDSFNGGWYDVPGRWEDRTSFPLSGCLDYKKPLGRTGGYRWMITDAYHYDRSIDFTIEHGPAGNLEQADYTSVTFFYSLESPVQDSPLPDAAARRISDPDKIIFVPGWNVPIRTFSLKNATLTKSVATIGNDRIRHLEFRGTGEDVFGDHHISFICEMPAAGRYKVEMKALEGPEQGIVRMYQYGNPAGDSVNLYSENRKVSPIHTIGTIDMAEGGNVVFLMLVGKDDRSEKYGLDLVELIFERIQ